MSANEKKIADFILGNIDYLRDYSSQQVASAVGVSQSSIVKFSQKLGYKGYPDLKLAINESAAISRADNKETKGNISNKDTAATVFKKYGANVNTVLSGTLDVNNEKTLQQAVNALDGADQILVVGIGRSQQIAQSFSLRLTEVGKFSVSIGQDTPSCEDYLHIMSKGDVLLVVTEESTSQQVLHLSQLAHQRNVTVIALSKFGSNQFASVANIELFAIGVSEDAQPFIGSLLIHYAQQQILDVLLITLSQLPKYKRFLTQKYSVN